MTVKFYREAFTADLYRELEPLAKEHAKIVNFFDKPLNVDIGSYIRSNNNQTYHMFTIRKDGDLVGYCGFYVYRHAHLNGEKHARQDALYIQQEFRAHCYRFLILCDRYLKKIGVKFVHQCVPESGRDFSKLLNRMGYYKIETTYLRRL